MDELPAGRFQKIVLIFQAPNQHFSSRKKFQQLVQPLSFGPSKAPATGLDGPHARP